VAPIPSVRKRVGDAAPATNTTPVEWAAPFGSALRIPATCISPAPNNDVGRAFVAPLTDLFRASRIRASPRRTIPADYRAGLRAHVNGLRASEMLGERFGIARSGRHRRHGLHQQDDGAGYGSVVQRSAHSTATETSTRRSSQGVIPQTYTARAASSIAASEECDEPQGIVRREESAVSPGTVRARGKSAVITLVPAGPTTPLIRNSPVRAPLSVGVQGHPGADRHDDERHHSASDDQPQHAAHPRELL